MPRWPSIRRTLVQVGFRTAWGMRLFIERPSEAAPEKDLGFIRAVGGEHSPETLLCSRYLIRKIDQCSLVPRKFLWKYPPQTLQIVVKVVNISDAL
jgi:hypothetical protein